MLAGFNSTLAALYFAIWLALAYFFNKWSLAQDGSGPEPWSLKLQLLSGPGLLLYGATVTFSSIDWVRESRRPQPVGSRSACLNFSARHTVLSLPLFTVLEVHSLGKMAVTALVVKAAGLPCAVEIASHG